MLVEKPRIQFLESIRGLAALMVVLYHEVYAFWPWVLNPARLGGTGRHTLVERVAHSPLTFAISGQFAISIFFVLSGFVLSYSFFRRGRVQSVQSAAVRRYVRLALPALLSVLASYGLLKHHMYHNLQAGALIDSAWLKTWYGFKPRLEGFEPNSAIWQGLYGVFFADAKSYNHVLWTMSIELPGSFLIFCFLALYGAARNRWVLYLAVGGLLWAWFRVFLLDFLVGAALCDAYCWLELRRQPRFELGWIAAPLLVLGCWLGRVQPLVANPTDSQMAWWEATFSAGAILVVGVPLFSNLCRRVLDWRPLAVLGRLSFGLYLAHVLVICSLGSAVYVHLRTVAHWSHNASALAAMGVSLPVSLAGGFVFYFAGDLPSIALGKWLQATFFTPRLAALPVAAPAVAVGSPEARWPADDGPG